MNNKNTLKELYENSNFEELYSYIVNNYTENNYLNTQDKKILSEFCKRKKNNKKLKAYIPRVRSSYQSEIYVLVGKDKKWVKAKMFTGDNAMIRAQEFTKKFNQYTT